MPMNSMNSTNRNAGRIGTIPQPSKRQADDSSKLTPVAALKNRVSRQRVARAVAPPVGKPETSPAVTQSKSGIRSAKPNASAMNVRHSLTGRPAFRAPGKLTGTQVHPVPTGTKAVAPRLVPPRPSLTVLQQKSNGHANRNLKDASTTEQNPAAGRAARRFEAPIGRAPFSPVARAGAITVVQRAQDWSKYDDLWWPKAYRVNGPYKGLDLWDSWGQATRYGSFSSYQISLLIAANKKRNKGVLKSDADNDPYEELSEIPGRDDSVECDHVITKNGGGGANHWWNARLISRKLNNSLERGVAAHQK